MAVFGASFGDLPFWALPHSLVLKPEHFMKDSTEDPGHLVGSSRAGLERGLGCSGVCCVDC